MSGCMLPEAHRQVILLIDKLQFGEVAIFRDEEAEAAQRLVHNLNFGDIKEFVKITVSKRFRTFRDGNYLFIVRTT